MRGDLFRFAAGIILALLLAGSAAAVDANTTSAANQTPQAWEKTYGGLANETLISLLAPNGGYLLVGSSTGNGTAGELYLVRTDANGTPVREDRMPFGPGGAGDPAMASLTAENGVAVVGGTGAAGSGEDVALLRLAPDGRQLWYRSYAVGNGRDRGAAVRPATDGGYLVAGTTDSPTGGTPDLLLLKVGEDGGEIWHRILAFDAGSLLVDDLLATPDRGYLIIGSTDAYHPGSSDILLVKVSSGGSQEWQRIYSFGAEAATGATLEPSPDGGWLLLGDVAGTGPHAAVLVKVDSAGSEQWRKRLSAGGAPTWGYGLAPAGTDGYAVAGAVAAPEGTRSYVARFDRSGTEVWNRSFAIGNGPSRALAVTAGIRDQLVVGGDASRTTDLLYDLYLSSVMPPAVAPNATPTATVNATPNATATPTATPTANATSTTATAVPATTQASPVMPLGLIAVLGAVLVAAAARRR